MEPPPHAEAKESRARMPETATSFMQAILQQNIVFVAVQGLSVVP
jgi:hypothetical protein